MRKITVDKMNTIYYLCALRFERAFTDVTLVVNSAQAPLRHPRGST